ncbi:HYR domain-containing protein [Streptomyces sp. NPDC021020]|uniref:HYR domain-containing protein n=1 Tax=Streptomyces sp. NPDC021020 TaxID=3365109 RepID=UPI0037BC3628
MRQHVGGKEAGAGGPGARPGRSASRALRLGALVAGLLLVAGAAPGMAAGPSASPSVVGPPVQPQVVDQALAPGESTHVAKTVDTPTIPPRPDVVLMIDDTGSMKGSISNVAGSMQGVANDILKQQPDARFALTAYGDVTDGADVFTVEHQLTSDVSDMEKTWFHNLTAERGYKSDGPAEDWINGLWQIANGADGRITFRPEASPIVVLIGDASSHDPSVDHSLDSAIGALKSAGVRVLAIDIHTDLGDGLDGDGKTPENHEGTHDPDEATKVVNATGGKLMSGVDQNAVTQAISSGLTNLPTTVTYEAVNCDPALTVSLAPASRKVTSGETASFDETISVAPDAPQGAELTCAVQFLLDGKVPGADAPAVATAAPVRNRSGTGPARTALAAPPPEPANDYQEIIGIAVRDVTAPVVTLDSRSVEAQGSGGAHISYTATAVDGVDGPLPVACTPASGSLFPLGATTVTCTATDGAGNTGSAQATFTVLPKPIPDQADLAVHIGVGPTPTYTGGRTLAQVTLTNAGPRAATGVVVSSVWPATAAGGSSVGAPTACTSAKPCTIPPGGRVTLLQQAVYHVPLTGTVKVAVHGSPADPRTADNTATATVRVLQPKLTVTPAVVRPGDVVVVRGTDFPPGTAVPLSWSRGITARTDPALVEPDGTFAAQVVVLPRDLLGARDLRATPTGYDPPKPLPVLVVQQTVQPPDFAARG